MNEDALKKIIEGGVILERDHKPIMNFLKKYCESSDVMPEKKEWNQLSGRDGKMETDGYNQAIEACTLIVTKGWVKKEERVKVYCTHMTDCRCERCEPPKEAGK